MQPLVMRINTIIVGCNMVKENILDMKEKYFLNFLLLS